MSKKKINENNINNLSFKEALEKLENITKNYKNDDSTLENAVNLYNRGLLLKKHCEKKLEETKNKKNQLEINSNKIKIKKNITELSFQDAEKELDETSNIFEKEDTTLEDSIILYEKGLELMKHIEKKLEEYEKKIKILNIDSNNRTIEKIKK